eukprot:2560900-Rhodomonas_salina.1
MNLKIVSVVWALHIAKVLVELDNESVRASIPSLHIQPERGGPVGVREGEAVLSDLYLCPLFAYYDRPREASSLATVVN